ncbi:hypothetical protein CPT_Ptah_013 [Stenotrophomonas phage Ptah]|uniref:Uncharacterized protein n=1 Tax=Stenotrophomonas phage Ptah TaxID=2859657 RepID=A0AAE7WLL6_9CAUD|nr:hypothetical protein CPT_Ptah_013 [Stenotrophomonas phage Ptah]
MGIWELAKKLGKGVVNMLRRPTKHVFAVHPSTSEEVRQGLRSTGAEVVETKPIPEPSLFERAFRGPPVRYRQGYVLGETFDIGINRVKRAIRALPKKEQRAARSAFIKNLRASGVKN